MIEKRSLPRIQRKRDQNKMKQLWKKVLFPFPSPAGKQILEKDHFAMQTRLNLRRQLFGKITEELFIFYFSSLSMNQCSKRILQRCVVFMAYVDSVNEINTTYILKIKIVSEMSWIITNLRFQKYENNTTGKENNLMSSYLEQNWYKCYWNSVFRIFIL